MGIHSAAKVRANSDLAGVRKELVVRYRQSSKKTRESLARMDSRQVREYQSPRQLWSTARTDCVDVGPDGSKEQQVQEAVRVVTVYTRHTCSQAQRRELPPLATLSLMLNPAVATWRFLLKTPSESAAAFPFRAKLSRRSCTVDESRFWRCCSGQPK